MRKIKLVVVNICLVLAGFIVALFIAEIGLRIVFHDDLSFQQAMSEQNYPRVFTSVSNIPWTLKSGANDQHIGRNAEFSVSINISQQGLRNEIVGKKQTGTTRILMLGDSMTFGYGVEKNNTLPKQIEKRLLALGKNVEVINAGYAGGFGPDTQYVWYRDNASWLDPDIIVYVAFPHNDLVDVAEKCLDW